MIIQQPQNSAQSERNKEGITCITVGGFKSIVQEQKIEIRPLTILAGANSSGKSSIMQPLLLLKQTLEAPYDPGALLLNGPNVRFSLVDQLLSRISERPFVNTFYVGIDRGPNLGVTTHFIHSKNKRLDVDYTIHRLGEDEFRLYSGMSQRKIRAMRTKVGMTFNGTTLDGISESSETIITRDRCFLTLSLKIGDNPFFIPMIPNGLIIGNYIQKIIHLPGLRGNPERTYPITAVGSEFPGTFENYVASVIEQWQRGKNTEKLGKLNRDLFKLGLTTMVTANAINDTQVEILVNRFPYHSKSSPEDMVNVADVGLGVSQALPVLVALHAANQGQLVYLEQPEIHLHPRAQSAMAEVLANAVLEGKRVVVETHSSLLLLGIQTLVAEGKLPPEMVKLHWFTQQEDGSTKIDSADLDKAGAFGDWPEDFDTVSLDSEGRYIDAAHANLKGN